ncbi:MAG: hypothetical protein FWD68_09290 [Alphaproteobacteria bacterium]|nr:hypothetical protein [Alphaproteobacteria bacterium]
MISHGWIARRVPESAEEIIRDLSYQAGRPGPGVVAFFKKNDIARANAKADPYALTVWCLQVLALASASPTPNKYRAGVVTPQVLREVVRLSGTEAGPSLARDFLAGLGIHLVVLNHLQRTYLDGAALKLTDGTPVVDPTLRYDRIDNFWFCLLHELAHVALHLGNSDVGFVDDITLRGNDGIARDVWEKEADHWAEEACVPNNVWEKSSVRLRPTPASVVHLANSLQIHPAIVAGRVRQLHPGNHPAAVDTFRPYLAGSRAGAPADLAIRCVSSPRHVTRNVRFSRIAHSHFVHVEAYVAFRCRTTSLHRISSGKCAIERRPGCGLTACYSIASDVISTSAHSSSGSVLVPAPWYGVAALGCTRYCFVRPQPPDRLS